MSDPGPLAALERIAGGTVGFARDPRFAAPAADHPAAPPAEDQRALDFAEGYAAAQAELREQAAAEAADRHRIELALLRLDDELRQALESRLIATVEALCEAAVLPLALDRDLLVRRVERAAAMLARADDTRLLRLHPDDLALIGTRLPEGLAVQSDPGLERGAVRIESEQGGVEDTPAGWRRAIAEALGEC